MQYTVMIVRTVGRIVMVLDYQGVEFESSTAVIMFSFDAKQYSSILLVFISDRLKDLGSKQFNLL